MMKVNKKEKKYKSIPDYRYLFLLIALLVTGICLLTVYKLSFRRLAESLRDLALSLAFYFTEMFTDGGYITPTVNQFPNIRIEDVFPWDWLEFSRKLTEMWAFLFTEECFATYMISLSETMRSISYGVMVGGPLIFFGVYMAKSILLRPGKQHRGDTKPLQIFKKIVKAPFLASADWLRSFLGFCVRHSKIIILIILLWVCNFNITTMIIEFFAFYFYFIASFNLADLLIQAVKLLVDVLIMLNGAPMIFWIIVGFVIFHAVRKSIGYSRLQHYEMQNRGFINSLPVVCMACGTMGAKKTTLITDMALSTEAMFRDKALELLFKNEMKLPNFPWRQLEDKISEYIKTGQAKNIATLKKCLENRKRMYLLHGYPQLIWNYDTELFRAKYNDALWISEMWDIIITYAQLYFLYTTDSSLMISNYSIRTDAVLSSEGNFPLWQMDFFKTKPGSRPSRHAHILDFDLLRLGKRMDGETDISGSLEYGVVVWTEVGKERQNALELKEVKKNTDEANQKNDLTNTEIKLSRHHSVIDNQVFFKIFTDEQRAESWGADARQLCTIMDILKCGDIELAMPGFLFGDLIFDFFYNRFQGFCNELAYYRGDNTLFGFIMRNIAEKFLTYYRRIYNTFGVMKIRLGTQSGTLDAQMEEHKYFLTVKKIYANRFATDAYAEFFRDKALAAKWSILFAPEYEDTHASVDELKQQHSYLIRDLTLVFEDSEPI